MKHNPLFIFLLGVVFGFGIFFFYSTFISSSIEPVFSPDGAEQVLSFIDSAERTLDIEMYVFTSDEVAQALLRAHERGVRVRIILEKRVLSAENKKVFDALQSGGIDIAWATEEYKLTHAKFIIADGGRLFIGSHNFSNSALHGNREASVIIHTLSVVNEFRRIFEEDWLKAAGSPF